jgi:hypothetical protein
LGYELGGLRVDPQNFVSQLNLSNAPAQSSLENAIKDTLTPTTSSTAPAPTGQVYVRATPAYFGTCVVPYEIQYEAIGLNGWQLPTSATGIAAQWLRFDKGPDGITVAHIRNTVRIGGQWQVSGQDPKATCVPPGYAG